MLPFSTCLDGRNLRFTREAYGEFKVELLWVNFFGGHAAATVRILGRIRSNLDVSITINQVISKFGHHRRWRGGALHLKLRLAVAILSISFVIASASGGGGGGGGDGGVERTVRLRIDSSVEEFPFYVGVPIVLDLIIGSSR